MTDYKSTYAEDLKDIRKMMSRSSRFHALSGVSGISAGIVALLGSCLVWFQLNSANIQIGFHSVTMDLTLKWQLLWIALGTLLLAKTFVVILTWKKMKKQQVSFKSKQISRLLVHLFLPLLTGGLIIIKFLFNGYLGLSIAFSLLFYGLALINVSKYTLDDIRVLGIIQTVLGLLAVYFSDFSLYLWTAGFGITHILFGIYLHRKLTL